MKKIINFTFAWDLITKTGYLTLIDEDGERHAFQNLGAEELQLLAHNLENYPAYIDQSHWILWGTPESHD